MKTWPVIIAGGGPVGMTLAADLASRGVACLLVERNETTTRHPKMDITNSRSMELFRRLGLEDSLRAAAIPEIQPLDVSWITTFSGHQLYRFVYPSPAQARENSRIRNDGAQPRVPAMRVSQVIVEPVLKARIDAEPLVDVRFGVALEDFREDEDGVEVVLRDTGTGEAETLRCLYLAGCDGGASRVRAGLGIGLAGEPNNVTRFMTHFRSDVRDLLQRWGPAWHYQSNRGTLIAQNDRDVWTLHTRIPPSVALADVKPENLIADFVGRPIAHKILVANAWEPRLLLADRYGSRRVFLAGDAAHQYIPTGGYGMNTGIGDAADLAWKLAATVQGFGGPELLASYEQERRPIGLRNREASAGHSSVRLQIGALYADDLDQGGATGDALRARTGTRIAQLGNAENESMGIEMGYWYANSAVIWAEPGAAPPQDPLRYEPTTVPGVRLPSIWLSDGSALYDRLGPWFTLLVFGHAQSASLVQAAKGLGLPLKLLELNEPEIAPIYQARMILVRPDHHVAWRGDTGPDAQAAQLIIARCLGWPIVGGH